MQTKRTQLDSVRTNVPSVQASSSAENTPKVCPHKQSTEQSLHCLVSGLKNLSQPLTKDSILPPSHMEDECTLQVVRDSDQEQPNLSPCRDSEGCAGSQLPGSRSRSLPAWFLSVCYQPWLCRQPPLPSSQEQCVPTGHHWARAASWAVSSDTDPAEMLLCPRTKAGASFPQTYVFHQHQCGKPHS